MGLERATAHLSLIRLSLDGIVEQTYDCSCT